MQNCSVPASSSRTNYTTQLVHSNTPGFVQQINITDLSLLSLHGVFTHILCVSQVSASPV